MVFSMSIKATELGVVIQLSHYRDVPPTYLLLFFTYFTNPYSGCIEFNGGRGEELYHREEDGVSIGW